MLQDIVKPLAKGQITIPVKFRQSLGIKEDTLLRVEIKDDGLFLRPVSLDWTQKYVRDFSDQEIASFLKEDKLDKKARTKLKKYLS